MGISRPAHTYILKTQQVIEKPLEEVFRFFSSAENLQAITPSWLDFQILSVTPGELHSGTRIRYMLRWHRIRLKWVTEIIEWDPPHGFTDLQLSGPYRWWRHEHRFLGELNSTLMTDRVEYALPFGMLGRLSHVLVRNDLRRIFDFRREAIASRFG